MSEHQKLCRVLQSIIKKRYERYKEIKSYLNYIADYRDSYIKEGEHGTNQH